MCNLVEICFCFDYFLYFCKCIVSAAQVVEMRG